ncbi:cobalt ECF transporter T component CbiQ [Desulfatiferula olefinivorans]
MRDGSCVHDGAVMVRFDPRLKVMLLIWMSVLIAVAKSPCCLGAGAVLAGIAACFSGLTAREVLTGLLPVNGMVVFLWLVVPFSLPGEVLWTLGPFSASSEGIRLALLITAKANILMLSFIVYTASTPLVVTGQALSRLGLSGKLTRLLLFTYRYIAVIHDEYRRMKTAMIIRGFVPKTSLHTYRTYACLLGMVLVKSAARAERVHQAMLCRGFDGRFHSLSEFSFHRRDAVLLALSGVWITTMGILEWTLPAL